MFQCCCYVLWYMFFHIFNLWPKKEYPNRISKTCACVSRGTIHYGPRQVGRSPEKLLQKSAVAGSSREPRRWLLAQYSEGPRPGIVKAPSPPAAVSRRLPPRYHEDSRPWTWGPACGRPRRPGPPTFRHPYRRSWPDPPQNTGSGGVGATIFDRGVTN